ncbi:MAG: cation:proton antiporter [Methanomassiliicoccales archaeon]
MVKEIVPRHSKVADMELATNTILFELGALLLIAFIGAAIAMRAKQSAILGYIVVGILIGPFIYINIGDFTYSGLIKETEMVDILSQLGILLLLFFVGLEFSMDKIKRVKGPAIILSLVDVSISLFVGFMLAFGLGWPLVDSIFLAAVMAMSCSAVAMKTLMELGRMGKPETEYIMGMIILEEFISMIFLAVVGGLVIKINPDFSVTSLIIGMTVFFVFFAILAVFVIPRTVQYLSKMKSDEMFVLFMLGVVFLSTAFATFCGVPALIGAFFIGMVFAETKVMNRMERKIAPIRDAFVAIFFISFGMLINPSLFLPLLPVIVLAVVLLITAELLVMPFVAYLIGFNRRAAVTIGSSFSARGGESVMYASVGAQVPTATKGAELTPIAGAIMFIMSALCPFFIKKSYQIADYMAMRFPASIKYGGAVFARTVSRMVFPATLRQIRLNNGFLLLLAVLVVTLIATASTSGWEHYMAFAVALALCIVVYLMLVKKLRPEVRLIDYSNLGTLRGSDLRIARFIAQAVSLGLVMVASVCFMFPLFWPSVIVISLAYVLWFAYLMKMVHHRTCPTGKRP